jgi:hypothetical protein
MGLGKTIDGHTHYDSLELHAFRPTLQAYVEDP